MIDVTLLSHMTRLHYTSELSRFCDDKKYSRISQEGNRMIIMLGEMRHFLYK